MEKSITIKKNPEIAASNDYYLLRQKGLEYIQELGSKYWTDYNIHDPGITILEALCYAITDLGYRTSLDIKDLLAEPENKEATPAERQGFYTAREILTNSAYTINDYRKLLIDLSGIKNGWLHCLTTPCDDIRLYAGCEESILKIIRTDESDIPVLIKGLYDVLIEFEDEEKTGNLNSGKIKYRFSYQTDNGYTSADIEIRLPSWNTLETKKMAFEIFRRAETSITKIQVKTISRTKHDQGMEVKDVTAVEMDNALRKPLYASIEIEFDPGTGVISTLLLPDIPFMIWFNSIADRKSLKSTAQIKSAISDLTPGGIIPKYLEKIKKADSVILRASQLLHANRNLAEDFCTIRAIEVEDFAICADLDVEATADIEAILSEAFYLIDQYFSPDIKFYSLMQLLDAGTPVDEIFEGPSLVNGFINEEQLESTSLRKVLFTSDIINILMDINGVKSVKNLVLLKYDGEGNIVSPVQSWSITVSESHQPRLYIEACKVLVFKNGLPFLPDRLELSDSLPVVKGRLSQPQFAGIENDLPVPTGTYYEIGDYYPIQNSLPSTYGIGELGLPAGASQRRNSQAKQLKAYLMFFEQMLVNYLQQLGNIKEFFAIDKSVTHTYFTRFISTDMVSGLEIPGEEGIYNGLTKEKLESLVETTEPGDPGFLDRRNRFLDHLLARFGEEFNEYALMLYSYTNDQRKTQKQLIDDKIDFLKALPFTSSNRGRALNYKDETNVCSVKNMSGFQKRIELLLNIDDFGFLNFFEFYKEKDKENNICNSRWRFIDEEGNIFLRSNTSYPHLHFEEVTAAATMDIAEVCKHFRNPDNYSFEKDKKWILLLHNNKGDVIATGRESFKSKSAAINIRTEIINYAEKITQVEKLFIVEHVLLRPVRIKPVITGKCKKILSLSFEIYEEKDKDGKLYEKRWRLIDSSRKIYLSSSTRYTHNELEEATKLAKNEIKAVTESVTNISRYQVKKEIKWVLNLLDETGEIIATRKEHFPTHTSAIAARNEIINAVENFTDTGTRSPGEHTIGTIEIPVLEGKEEDLLLPVCLTAGCDCCSDIDPYSFRITVVINGEDGPAGTDMDFRNFAEQTIRQETPAHLGIKVCWVSKMQLLQFTAVYCLWRTEVAKSKPDSIELHKRLLDLLRVFKSLKNIYPPATLHDCADGNDVNRVFLGRTII